MTDPDIAIHQEADPTPSHKKGLHLKEDQYLIPEGLGDHVQQTDDHLIEGDQRSYSPDHKCCKHSHSPDSRRGC